jgi:hypothetical protein
MMNSSDTHSSSQRSSSIGSGGSGVANGNAQKNANNHNHNHNHNRNRNHNRNDMDGNMASSSVEEAGAMVGASITKLTLLGMNMNMNMNTRMNGSSGGSSSTALHSSGHGHGGHGGTSSNNGIGGIGGIGGSSGASCGNDKAPIASSELFFRLDDLRRWLERWDRTNLQMALEQEQREQQEQQDKKDPSSSSSSSYSRHEHNRNQRDHDQQPLYHAAAPSLVAVLNKLLSLSNPSSAHASAASSSSSSSSYSSTSTTCTPMLSHAIRISWAKSMVHCYRLGLGYQGDVVQQGAQSPRTKAAAAGGAMNVRHLVKQLLDVVALNPRSAKAFGGTRYAALELLKLLLQDPFLSPQIFLGGGGGGGGFGASSSSSSSSSSSVVTYSPHELILILYKYVKQATHDVTCRKLLVEVASGVLTTARWNRQHQLQMQQVQALKYGQDIPRKQSTFLVLGALEEKTIVDSLKLLRRVSEDSYPEVRYQGAVLAGILAPVVTLLPKPTSSSGGGSGPPGIPAPSNHNNDSSSAGSSSSNKLEISPMVHLDELLSLCLRNGIADEYPWVQKAYCAASARCTCSAMDAVQLFGMHLPNGRGGVVLPHVGNNHASGGGGTATSSAGGADNDVGDDPSTGVGGGSASSGGIGIGTGIGIGIGLTPTKTKIMARWKSMTESRLKAHAPLLSFCGTLQSTLDFFVTQFLKAGGEYVPNIPDGGDVAAGRALRVGYSQCFLEVLRLYHRVKCSSGSSGNISGMTSSSTFTTSDMLTSLFAMVGPGLQLQLLNQNSKNAHSNSANSNASASSPSDAAIARLLTSRILRRGLGELATEQSQQSLCKDLSEMCLNGASPLDALQAAKQLSIAALTSGVDADTNSSMEAGKPNEHQLQVGLVELSHLLTAMGEAAPSVLDSHVLPALERCIGHAEAGVRLEAASVFGALARSVPGFLHIHLMRSLQKCRHDMESLIALVADAEEASNASKAAKQLLQQGGGATAAAAHSNHATTSSPTNRRRGFGRGARGPKEKTQDPELVRRQAISSASFLYHQYSLHGNALVTSMLIHEVVQQTKQMQTQKQQQGSDDNDNDNPRHLPLKVIFEVVDLAESLVWCQFNEPLARINAGAACTCVRAGYSLLSATLSIGPSTNTMTSTMSTAVMNTTTATATTTTSASSTTGAATTGEKAQKVMPQEGDTNDNNGGSNNNKHAEEEEFGFGEDDDDDGFGEFGGFEEAEPEEKQEQQQQKQPNPQEDEDDDEFGGFDDGGGGGEEEKESQTATTTSTSIEAKSPTHDTTADDADEFEDDGFGEFGGFEGADADIAGADAGADAGTDDDSHGNNEVLFGDKETSEDDIHSKPSEQHVQVQEQQPEQQSQSLTLLQRSFLMWAATSESIERGTKYFSPPHDLICLEAMMASLLSFLRFGSPLLLSVPQALNSTLRMLEQLLPLVATPQGRLGLTPKNGPALARLESVRASFMETFSWLPPGSYPMVADTLFQLSAQHIQQASASGILSSGTTTGGGGGNSASDNNNTTAHAASNGAYTSSVTCTSLLSSLIPREDLILDARSYCRSSNQVAEVDGSRDMEELLVALTVDPAAANEREAVLHCLPWRNSRMNSDDSDGDNDGDHDHYHDLGNNHNNNGHGNRKSSLSVITDTTHNNNNNNNNNNNTAADDDHHRRNARILDSSILGFVDFDDTRFAPPSVLHLVSNWRKPAYSASHSKTRLLDAALQSFAATFGLQSGREQDTAIALLRQCLPITLIEAHTGASTTSAFSVKEALMSDQERRLKVRCIICACSVHVVHM